MHYLLPTTVFLIHLPADRPLFRIDSKGNFFVGSEYWITKITCEEGLETLAVKNC
jgi:hypothetical protein